LGTQWRGKNDGPAVRKSSRLHIIHRDDSPKVCRPPQLLQKSNRETQERNICNCRSNMNVYTNKHGNESKSKILGIGKSSAARATFKDLIVLVRQVAQRPTHVCELCSTSIDYGGYCDACGTGIGGVFSH
jgi:hypothetical protein